MPVALEQFVQHLTQSGLMSATELASFLETLPPDRKPQDAESLARQLVRANKLTRYQVQVVYQGKVKGLVFGEYRVLDELGQGGMGVVLKAEHRRMERLVAVKMLPAAMMKSPQAVQRFYREVKAAAKLNHPNIVQAHDASEHEGLHYLAMEYVDGKDLSAIIKEKGPLPVAHAIECVLQAARGLQYAHKQGIVHRDIKPANLLVDKEGTVKILDMGLARIAGVLDQDDQDRLTASGQVMGTCDYMAPEQALDSHHADARADIYSLGCTLYRLLTGKVLFRGETVAQIILAHQQASVPSLCEARSDVPQEVDAVFRKMVAKKPGDRQQSMVEVIADLERCVGQQARVAPSLAEHASDSGARTLQGVLSFLDDGPHVGSATAAKKQVQPAELTETQSFHPEQETRSSVGVAGRLLGTPRRKQVLVATVGLALLGVVFFALIIRFLPHGPGAPTPAVAPFDAKRAKQHQEAWAKHLGVPVEYTNTRGMKFILIPPGEFTMGSTPAELEDALKIAGDDKYWQECIKSEAPQHKVTLTPPIYLGIHEVTQTQYKTVMGQNPSNFAATGPGKDTVAGVDTSTFPVEMVSWNEAAEFCAKLSEQERLKPFYHRADEAVTMLDGTGYRLPTEAEWEFACRAGTTTKYWIGDKDDDLPQAGWFDANSGYRTHAVGELKANPFGLYDIHGNVWEWVQDWWEPTYYGQFQGKPALDPSGPSSAGSLRVLRGGDWHYHASYCRASGRDASGPTLRDPIIGFRVALMVGAVKQAIKNRGAQATEHRRRMTRPVLQEVCGA